MIISKFIITFLAVLLIIVSFIASYWQRKSQAWEDYARQIEKEKKYWYNEWWSNVIEPHNNKRKDIEK